ncbi:hypothetical protein Btru_076813 [Bulinus truncatus]|nr:hypothetical protein Btru_076813 [Bulinus truncatus]
MEYVRYDRKYVRYDRKYVRYDRKYVRYDRKYVRYDRKYVRYDRKYVRYDRKYVRYDMKYVRYDRDMNANSLVIVFKIPGWSDASILSQCLVYLDGQTLASCHSVQYTWMVRRYHPVTVFSIPGWSNAKNLVTVFNISIMDTADYQRSRINFSVTTNIKFIVGVANKSSSPYNDTRHDIDIQESHDDPLDVIIINWIFIAFSCVVLVIGLLGNCLVWFAVWRNPRMRSATNIFLVNLAVADFLVILICLPPTVAEDITGNWYLGREMCKIVKCLQVSGVVFGQLNCLQVSGVVFGQLNCLQVSGVVFRQLNCLQVSGVVFRQLNVCRDSNKRWRFGCKPDLQAVQIPEGLATYFCLHGHGILTSPYRDLK